MALLLLLWTTAHASSIVPHDEGYLVEGPDGHIEIVNASVVDSVYTVPEDEQGLIVLEEELQPIDAEEQIDYYKASWDMIEEPELLVRKSPAPQSADKCGLKLSNPNDRRGACRGRRLRGSKRQHPR